MRNLYADRPTPGTTCYSRFTGFEQGVMELHYFLRPDFGDAQYPPLYPQHASLLEAVRHAKEYQCRIHLDHDDSGDNPCGYVDPDGYFRLCYANLQHACVLADRRISRDEWREAWRCAREGVTELDNRIDDRHLSLANHVLHRLSIRNSDFAVDSSYAHSCYQWDMEYGNGFVSQEAYRKICEKYRP